eukprot:6199585-Pleurochrysis_carterae.AAC.9
MQCSCPNRAGFRSSRRNKAARAHPYLQKPERHRPRAEHWLRQKVAAVLRALTHTRARLGRRASR